MITQFLFVCLALFPLIGVSDTQCPDSSIYNNTNNDDRRTDKTSLRLMQYNVEWLFLDYYGASDCPGDGCTWKNESEAQIHFEYVQAVIEDLDPDIINFCEIEGCDELVALEGNLTGFDYHPFLIKGTDTATGQNVGMLTRIDPIDALNRTEAKATYPVEGSQCGYTSNGTTGVSKHYISHFHIQGIDIAIVAAHLIAFPTDKARCSKREAQAMILQAEIAQHIQSGFEVIMMGDFNDFDNRVEDMNEDQPNSMVLDILKGNQGVYAGQYSTSVAQLVPKPERFTDWYDSDNNCNTSSKTTTV